MKRFEALAERLSRTIDDLDALCRRAAGQLERARSTGDDAYIDALALNLHAFYTGIEQAFESVAVNMDEALPEGPHWHRELLLQMSLAIPGLRPAVIGRDTAACLDDYRGFRHVVRNVYTLNLNPERVAALAGNLSPCLVLLRRDAVAFATFVHRLDDRSSAARD